MAALYIIGYFTAAIPLATLIGKWLAHCEREAI
jgi:hypothetical protein